MLKKEKKSVVFQIRLTPTEAEQIYPLVKRSRLEISDYLRFVVLAGTEVTVDVTTPQSVNIKSAIAEDIEEENQMRRKHVAG